MKQKAREKPLIALLTNNDDDIYCFRLELIRALITMGCEVLISCPYGEKFELMEDIEFIYDNPVIDRRGMNPLKDLSLFRHYKRLFKQYQPNIVLTYTAKPGVYGSVAARQLGIPYINNVTGFGSVLSKSKWTQKFIMALFKYAYSKASCIMFQNSTNMQLARECGMIKGAYKLIPGSGVNVERFPLQPYPKAGNGIVGEPVIFNYIGRILHDKGVDDYIEAAKKIKLKYAATEFNLIGFIEPTEHHYEDELKILEENGIIVYRGNQKDIRPYIARSHVTVHPSTYGEGLSNVLLESASSGRPLITTDNVGCRETLDDQLTGLLYHGGDVEQLTDRIKKFLEMNNDDRKSMGQRGREKVRREFSRDIVVNTYLTYINKILKQYDGVI